MTTGGKKSCWEGNGKGECQDRWISLPHAVDRFTLGRSMGSVPGRRLGALPVQVKYGGPPPAPPRVSPGQRAQPSSAPSVGARTLSPALSYLSQGKGPDSQPGLAPLRPPHKEGGGRGGGVLSRERQVSTPFPPPSPMTPTLPRCRPGRCLPATATRV